MYTKSDLHAQPPRRSSAAASPPCTGPGAVCHTATDHSAIGWSLGRAEMAPSGVLTIVPSLESSCSTTAWYLALRLPALASAIIHDTPSAAGSVAELEVAATKPTVELVRLEYHDLMMALTEAGVGEDVVEYFVA